MKIRDNNRIIQNFIDLYNILKLISLIILRKIDEVNLNMKNFLVKLFTLGLTLSLLLSFTTGNEIYINELPYEN